MDKSMSQTGAHLVPPQLLHNLRVHQRSLLTFVGHLLLIIFISAAPLGVATVGHLFLISPYS